MTSGESPRQRLVAAGFMPYALNPHQYVSVDRYRILSEGEALEELAELEAEREGEAA